MLERSAGTGGAAQVIGAYITDGVGAALGAGLSNIAFQIAALIIVLVFAYMALQIIIVLVEMYFVTSAGVLFIGMGGSSWTADFAVKTLVYAVSVGAKLMVMALILGIGIGMQVAQQWMDLDYTNFSTSVIVIGCAVVLAGVVKMVPELVQGMIQGASVTSAAPMIGAATSMAAAAGAAATAGVGAGMAPPRPPALADISGRARSAHGVQHGEEPRWCSSAGYRRPLGGLQPARHDGRTHGVRDE